MVKILNSIFTVFVFLALLFSLAIGTERSYS